MTEDVPGGLQECNADNQWRDVPIEPGCFIVNIGDLMARWTRDLWVSTLHRVVNPPAGSGPDSRRQSLIFFHNPNLRRTRRVHPVGAGSRRLTQVPTHDTGDHLRDMFTRTQNYE